MLPEEKARVKIDKQLNNAGWDIVDRQDYSQRFTLYCGQAQRPLSPDQQEIMKAIADYIINEGSISVTELNSIDTDLWRKAVKSFGIPALTAEMIDLSKFILKAA